MFSCVLWLYKIGFSSGTCILTTQRGWLTLRYDPEVECVCWSAPGIPKPGPHWPWQIRYSSLLNRQVNCRTRTIFFSGSLFHSFFTPAVLYWIVNKLMKQTAMHNSCFPLNSCVLNCKVWKKLYSEHCDLLWIPAVSHIAVW